MCKCNKSKKIGMVILTSMLMVATSLQVFASPEEGKPIVYYDTTPSMQIAAFDEAEFPTSEELFEGYVNKVFYGDRGISLFSMDTAGSRLTGNDKKVYLYLKAEFEKVAKGEREATAFEIPNSLFSDKEYYTAADLGVDAIIVNGNWNSEAKSAFVNLYDFDWTRVNRALLIDCPYEAFWYYKTKTAFCSQDFGYAAEYANGEWRIKPTQTWILNYVVEPAYRKSSEGACSVDSEKLKTTEIALNTAKKIVKDTENMSDYEKIHYYANRISDLNEYNHDAADRGSIELDSISPWQLIYVFDGDDTTNVVCEGYAKAFQYLCEMTEFNHPEVACYQVTGQLVDEEGFGGHMWNVVHMWDGKNYLFDVTNYDSFRSKETDRYFLLEGYDSLQDDIYVLKISGTTVGYVYDSYMYDYYDKSEIDIATSDYVVPEKTAITDAPEFVFACAGEELSNSFIEEDFPGWAFEESEIGKVIPEEGYMTVQAVYEVKDQGEYDPSSLITSVKVVPSDHNLGIDNRAIKCAFCGKKNINASSLDDDFTVEAMIYDGSQKNVDFSLFSINEENFEFVEGNDSAINSNSYSFVIQGKGEYIGKREIVWEIEKADSSLYDYVITYPDEGDEIIYNGEAKVAVATNGIGRIGLGIPTIKYVEKGGDISDLSLTPPVDAGEYDFYLDIAEGSNYKAALLKFDEPIVIMRAAPIIEIAEQSRQIHKQYGDPDFEIEGIMVTGYGDDEFTYELSSYIYEYLEILSNGKAHIVNPGTTKVYINVPETKNYCSISDYITVTIDKADIMLAEGEEVKLAEGTNLVYGQKISALEFAPAKFVYAGGEVEGTLKAAYPEEKPNAGETEIDWIFNPNMHYFKPLEGKLKINVEKATPSYNLPEYISVDCDGILLDKQLPEGFFWENKSEILEAGEGTVLTVKYIPEDTENYNTVQGIEVIAKAKQHEYKAYVTPPTCTEGGYTTYICESNEDHFYVDDETQPKGHTYFRGVCQDCENVWSIRLNGFIYETLIKIENDHKVGILAAEDDTTKIAASVRQAESVSANTIDIVGEISCGNNGETMVTTTVSENSLGKTYAEKIVIPRTVKQLGIGALRNFLTVTFEGEQAPEGIENAIAENATVYIPEGAADNYKKALGEEVKLVEIHTHKYADEWSFEEEYHWKSTICGHDEEEGVLEKMPHTMGEWVILSEATEDAKGEKERSCICGYKEQADIDKLPHTVHVKNDGIIITEATCMTTGLKKYDCSKCGAFMGDEIIPKKAHSLKHFSAVAATCINIGYIEYWKCNVCQNIFTDEAATDMTSFELTKISCDISNHEGERGIRNIVEATCQNSGYSGDIYCKSCHFTIAEGHVEDVKNHDVDVIPSTKPTCTTNGQYEMKKCKDCETIISGGGIWYATGHNLAIGGYVESTATTEGYSGNQYCTICNEIVAAGKTLPKTEVESDVTQQVGAKVEDDKSQGVYEITSTSAQKKEVAFTVSSKDEKTVKIPDSIAVGDTTYKVTAIEDKAFKSNQTITKVTLGKNIETIGKDAFKNCTSLKSITLQTKVTQIGSNAFSGCKKLKTITIKSTKLKEKSIAKNAFKGIKKGTTIKVPKKKLAAYKKLFQKKGLAKNVKIKAI